MGILKQIAESVFKNSRKYEAKDTKVKKAGVNEPKVNKEEQHLIEKEFLKIQEANARKNELEKIVAKEEVRWKTVEEEEHIKKLFEHAGSAAYKTHTLPVPGAEQAEHQSQAYHSNSHQHEHEKHYHSHNQQSNYQH